MLPSALCRLSVRSVDGAWAVNYLTERDHGWLAALMDEYASCRGLTRSALKERLAAPLPVWAPKGKRRIVLDVLDRACRAPQISALPPREARQVLFSLAARQARPRAALLDEAAAQLSVDPSALEAALFADLESERRVGELSPLLTPAALARETNLDIVESLLGRARELCIVAPEHTRALVRHARRWGLLCVVETHPSEPPKLHVSGPFSLFRQTRVYGRALGSLVRRALQVSGYCISADCQLSPRGDPVTLSVRAGDPIAAAAELALSEGPRERWFARDFRRLTRDWELVRDPEPLTAGGHLVFADFELRPRQQPGTGWLIEVVGFWTREYLLEKLARLAAAGLANVLLCVDTQRSCSDGSLPASPQLIPFRRRIDVAAVLARIDGRNG